MCNLKVAIVDDHRILRQGLKVLINDIGNMEVVIEASDGKEFIDKIETIRPDLAIVDINMPVMKGDEAIRLARLKYPDLKIIVLSMNNQEQYFKTMNSLGVDGYIIKESDYDELERAITTVMKGGKYFSQELLIGLLNNRQTTTKVVLSEREKLVLKYLCSGMSTAEIADKMCISVRTVEKHRSEMLLRTESPNSISLVVYAIKNGLVEV